MSSSLKPSYYNIYSITKTSTGVFNSISQNLIWIKNEDIEFQGSNAIFSKQIIPKLVDNGFLINCETDEQKKVKEKLDQRKFENQAFIRILPTLSCNLDCVYCYEKSIKNKDFNINGPEIRILASQISKLVLDQALNSIRLSWYGGEPLLRVDQIISLNKLLQKEFQDTLVIENEIVTNGILLSNEQIVKKLNQLDTIEFTIAIDGEKTNHNYLRRSKISNFDVFSTTIENIVKVSENFPVTITFILNKKNINSPIAILKDLAVKANIANISIHIGRLGNINDCLDSETRKLLISPRRLIEKEWRYCT